MCYCYFAEIRGIYMYELQFPAVISVHDWAVLLHEVFFLVFFFAWGDTHFVRICGG